MYILENMERREENDDSCNNYIHLMPKNNDTMHPATRYEAVLSEHRELLKNSDNDVSEADDDHLFSTSMHQTAAVIGALECAVAKSATHENMYKNKQDVDYLSQLIQHTIREKDNGVDWVQHLRKSSIAHPPKIRIFSNRDGDVINNNDAHRKNYANDFFQEYPECIRSSPILSDFEVSSQSGSSDEDDHQLHSYHTRKNNNPTDDSCGSSAHTITSCKAYCNQRSRRRRRQDLSNDCFQFSPQNTNHTNDNCDASPITRNPYLKNRASTKQASHNSNYKHLSNTNTNIGQLNENNNNWNDYTSTNTNSNPFCTANEFVVDDNHNPNFSDNYSKYRAQDEDNVPYSNESQNGVYRSQQSRQNDSNNNALKRPTFSAGLSKKFQLPKSKGSNNNNNGNGMASGSKKPQHNDSKNKSNYNCQSNDNENELPPELAHLDKELVDKIENEILCGSDTAKVTFDDIAGLENAKQMVLELVCWPMKRPDLFTGLRKGPNGLLLFGPPGTGKTLVGKAIASESGATFFSISSSSLTSKWIGEGEKLVRTLFSVAAYKEPAVVFIDEIDSLLTQRKSDENEASRRIKTEFLVQLDGTGTSSQGRVLVIGATNRPHELDDAARRRFVKRLYIPLPEKDDRTILLENLLSKNHHILSPQDVEKLANETKGYSGADLKALCTDAAMGPIRQLSGRISSIRAQDVPPISYKHFRYALRGMSPSVALEDLNVYLQWNQTYGNKSGPISSSSDEEEDEH